MENKISKLNLAHPTFEHDYGDALNWIHYEVDAAQLKREFVRWAATVDRGTLAEQIPSYRVALEGKIAYCLNRGAQLKPSSLARLTQLLDRFEAESTVAPEWEPIPETAAGRVIEAYVNTYSRLDNARTRVLRGHLGARELSAEVRRIVETSAGNRPAVMKQLVDHYREALVEARRDELIQSWVRPLTTILDTLTILNSSSRSRKNGKRQAQERKMAMTSGTRDRKGEAAASRVTVQEDNLDLGIQGVDPVNVVGAQAAVVFNTKTRRIEVYRAASATGLSVKGARLTNFDLKLSQGKTVRKPEESLPHWMSATNVRRLEVLMESVNGRARDTNGKLSKNTIIIRVMN